MFDVFWSLIFDGYLDDLGSNIFLEWLVLDIRGGARLLKYGGQPYKIFILRIEVNFIVLW